QQGEGGQHPAVAVVGCEAAHRQQLDGAVLPHQCPVGLLAVGGLDQPALPRSVVRGDTVEVRPQGGDVEVRRQGGVGGHQPLDQGLFIDQQGAAQGGCQQEAKGREAAPAVPAAQ